MGVKKKFSMPDLAINIGIVVYFLLMLPVAYYMPAYLAWENGPLEILQNVALGCNVILCLFFFSQN